MLKPRKNNKLYGQVIIEFTFCMIIVMLMMYSLIKIFRWTGVDLAERRIAHDVTLKSAVTRDYSASSLGDGPMGQIDTYFYSPIKINAVWRGP